MKPYRSTRLEKALTAAVLLCGLGLPGQNSPADPGWPRHYSNGTADLVVYQPQVDTWSDFKILTGRCAFALTPVRGRDPVYGTFRFQGDTLVDADHKVVLLRNLRALDMRFPSAAGGTSALWSDLTRQLLPSDALVVSLDRILAFVRAGEVPRKEARHPESSSPSSGKSPHSAHPAPGADRVRAGTPTKSPGSPPRISG